MLPTSSGIYIFATENKIIYVGKAKNLKNRISSYLLAANQIGKTKGLVNSATQISWVEVHSELQAIILEAHCIKFLSPKLNLRLKDDKSPLYIVITKEKYPRVLTSRNPHIQNSKYSILSYFGPFSSSAQARSLLQFARRAFPFCNATSLQKTRHQPCFYQHIGLCSGACTGNIPVASYKAMIRHLTQFLCGEQQKIISQLTHNMKAASSAQKYEAAAAIKAQLETLTHLLETQSVSEFADEIHQQSIRQKTLHELQQILHLSKLPARIECYDISNIQGKFASSAMVVAENGFLKPSKYRHFKIKSLFSPNDPGMIAETISRRLNHPRWGIPDLIVVDGGITQLRAAISASNRYPLVASHLSVIGLAKREETIITPQGEINLPRYSTALQLLQNLRDEAHRFSRRLHHKLHQKSLLYGKLKTD